MADLPVETWGTIFENTLEQDTMSLPTLLSVNRAWRRVASGTQQLWKQLVVDRKEQFTDSTFVRTYLQNSGTQPLDLHITVPVEVEDTRVITALLREHASRLRSLNIHVPTHEVAESLIFSISNGQPAPILEKLNISVGKICTEHPTFSALQQSFHPAPKLVHLGLPVIPLPDANAPLLATLKSLTLDAILFGSATPMDHVLDFIEALPHLHHFTFKSEDVFSYDATSEFDYPRIISMPNLISVDVSAPGSGLDIIRLFEAPLLTDVRFDGWRSWRGESHEGCYDGLTTPISVSLRRLAERSPKIERIELRYTKMHMLDPLEDYEWLLSEDAFPKLEVLRLDSVDIPDDALHATRGLKRLELRACESVTGEGLSCFIEGRGECFELFLDSCTGLTQEDINALSKVVKVELK